MAEDIILDPDPDSTHGATKAYRAAWWAAYGDQIDPGDDPAVRAAIYVDANGVVRVTPSQTLIDNLREDFLEIVYEIGGGSGDGGVALAAHLNDSTPHPVYDEIPSLTLLLENGLI